MPSRRLQGGRRGTARAPAAGEADGGHRSEGLVSAAGDPLRVAAELIRMLALPFLELSLPDRDGADAHSLRATQGLPRGCGVAVGDPRHRDLLLAEQLQALCEADRRDVRVEVALLLEIGEQRVEAGELRI